MQTKSTTKYEKKIEELTTQCQRKSDECHEAWMSLTAANEQLDQVRMELDNMTFKTLTLGKSDVYYVLNIIEGDIFSKVHELCLRL
jgi:kinesin family protein C2/C3